MIPVLRWRHRPACAAAAAQLLASFSTDPAEKTEAAAWAAAPPRGRRLAPLASPELDGRALPAGLQGGIRHLLRVLGPMLHRIDAARSAALGGGPGAAPAEGVAGARDAGSAGG